MTEALAEAMLCSGRLSLQEIKEKAIRTILLGHYRMWYIVVHFFPNALESIICSRFYVCLLLMIVHSICIVSIFVASILRDYLLCANLGELIFVVQSSKKGKPPSA